MQKRGQGSCREIVEEDGEGQAERKESQVLTHSPHQWPLLHVKASPIYIALTFWLAFKKELTMPCQSISQGRSQAQGKKWWEMLQSEKTARAKALRQEMCAERKPVQLEWRQVVWDKPGELRTRESTWKSLVFWGGGTVVRFMTSGFLFSHHLSISGTVLFTSCKYKYSHTSFTFPISYWSPQMSNCSQVKPPHSRHPRNPMSYPVQRGHVLLPNTRESMS